MTAITKGSGASRRALWFDSGLAAVLLVACETESVIRAVTKPSDTWPLPTVIIAAAIVTVPLIWRRRAVTGSTLVILAGVLLLKFALSGLQSINTPQFVLFIPPYSIAAYAPRTRALLGLAACVAAVAVVNATGPSLPSSWVFSMGAVGASWAAGRAIRGRRLVAAELNETAERISEERDSLEILAVAEQRTRIAAELQEVVADSVSAMIVLARTARELLEADLERADQTMDRIEETGRSALVDMRRILGVLRRAGRGGDLAPVPGVGRVAELVDASRRPDRAITLHVRGDPRPVPATVDLAVYRILDDALATSGDGPGNAVAVELTFEADRVDLEITLDYGCLAWPTPTMSELSGLCGGQIDLTHPIGHGERLRVQLPVTHDRIAT